MQRFCVALQHYNLPTFLRFSGHFSSRLRSQRHKSIRPPHGLCTRSTPCILGVFIKLYHCDVCRKNCLTWFSECWSSYEERWWKGYRLHCSSAPNFSKSSTTRAKPTTVETKAWLGRVSAGVVSHLEASVGSAPLVKERGVFNDPQGFWGADYDEIPASTTFDVTVRTALSVLWAMQHKCSTYDNRDPINQGHVFFWYFPSSWLFSPTSSSQTFQQDAPCPTEEKYRVQACTVQQ